MASALDGSKRIRAALVICSLAFSLAGCGDGATVGGPGPSGGSHASPSPAPGTSATPGPSASATPGSSTQSNGCGGTNSPEPAIPFPSATDPDAFYGQPSPFPNVPHGTLLGSRPSTYAPLGVTMTNTAYQIKFASCDRYNEPIAAVATIIEPLTPATGTEPLLVHNFFEDSLGPQCAPSHAETGATTQGLSLDTTVPTGALGAGWTVLAPDHEGPYSEYAAGPVEGHVVLDAILAAEQFAPAGLNANTPVGMYGYSGGAEATAWAASMQQTYAPNIKIAGIASGGTPADLAGAFAAVDGSSALDTVDNAGFFSILYMSAVGVNRAYPNFLTPTLNAKGIAAAMAMENGCGGKNSDGSSGPTGHFADYQNVSNWLSLPADQTVAMEGGLPQPGQHPIGNYFLFQSTDDEIIPVAGVDNLVSKWCADGTTIEYYRDDAGGDHNTMAEIGMPLVLAYMMSRFNGTGTTVPPTSTTCN